jgi:hypothetical protein
MAGWERKVTMPCCNTQLPLVPDELSGTRFSLANVSSRSAAGAYFHAIIIMRGFCGFHGWRLRQTHEIAKFFVAASGTQTKTV